MNSERGCIRPVQKDEVLLADIQESRRQGRAPRVWWLGQSGFLVLIEGRFLLLDPYLSDSLTLKYAQTDKPHVRISELVVSPARLSAIDVVTSSHNHTDHLDPETLRPLVAMNPQIHMVCPEANRTTVRERSGLPEDKIIGLDLSLENQVRTVAGFEFHAIPAAHETLEKDLHGRPVYLGWVIRRGGWTLYHSGDTILFPGMVNLLRGYSIDLAFLPINGRDPARRVAGNLSGREAAQLASAAGMRQLIPCHYDLFAFNTASPEEFAHTCGLLGQSFHILSLGEGMDLQR